MCNNNVLEDKAITLSEEEYNYCIENFDTMEAKEMLFRGHIKWALKLSRKFYSNRFTRDEIDAEGLVGLWRGIKMFEPDKGFKLITFITPVINTHVYNYIRKYKDDPSEESLNTPIKSNKDRGNEEYFINIIEDNVDHINTHENRMIFIEAMNILPDIEKEVFEAYYIKNIPQRKIQVSGKKTQCNTSRVLKRARGRIIIYLAKGYIRKGKITEDEINDALKILIKDKAYFI